MYSHTRPYVKLLNNQLFEETIAAIEEEDRDKLENIRHEVSFRKRKAATSIQNIIDRYLDF